MQIHMWDSKASETRVGLLTGLENGTSLLSVSDPGILSEKNHLTITLTFYGCRFLMHFRWKHYPRSSVKFLLNGFSLPFVSQYKYLGVILDEHITFKEAAANKLDQAKKAFWSIQGELSSVPGDAYKIIFESLVVLVLDYCSPIWSHSLTPSSLERLQQHVYRYFLGVGRNHALAAAAGDLC